VYVYVHCTYIYFFSNKIHKFTYLQPLFSSYAHTYIYTHTSIRVYTYIVYIAVCIKIRLHCCTRALQWCTYIPWRTICYVCVYYLYVYIYWLFNLLTGRVKRKNVPLHFIKYKSPGCRTHPPDRLYILKLSSLLLLLLFNDSRSKLRAFMHIMSFIFILIGLSALRLVRGVCSLHRLSLLYI